MEKSLKRQDYHSYEFSRQESGAVILAGVGIVAFFAWFFYRSFWAVFPLSPLGILMIRQIRAEKGEKRILELTEQFKECILSVSASLQAGYAVENAFMESREDIRNLYGEGSGMYEELEVMRRGLVVNVPLEELLLDFGERSSSAEIAQFAQMFAIAKRGGGNLPEMIRTSANLISQKMEARSEVATLLSGRKMEQLIMRFMPFGIAFYVGNTYRDYFSPLYHSVSGVLVMTVCLGLYLTSVWLGERIFHGIWEQMEGGGKKEKLLVMDRKGVIGHYAKIGEKCYLLIEDRWEGILRKEELRRELEIICEDMAREDLLTKYYGGKIGLSLLILSIGGILGGCLWIKERSAGSLEKTSIIILILCACTSIMVFFLMDKDLKDQVLKRRERMRRAYPDLVHKLALYLVAGMSIRSAFLQIGKKNELAGYACREMQAGVSEQLAYEHFGKRAGVREYVKLSTLLCQNLKKGSKTLLPRLEEEAILTEESRIQSGKKLGEEAGTKLLIPMVMQLAMIMLMIMVPAFSMMGV